MIVDQQSAIAIVKPIGVNLGAPKSVEITLDEAWSVYCRATVVFDIPDEATRAAIDLRETPLRLDLRTRRDFGTPWSVADFGALIGGSVAGLTSLLNGGPLANVTHALYAPWNGSERPAQLRNFDLYVTERTFDDKAREMTIVASSNEALLFFDILASSTPLDPGTTSVLAIVKWVLARYGASLSDDSLDATVAQSAATVWQPGTSASDYLDSMLEAASLRLWCDEVGTFRVGMRQALVAGSIALPEARLIESTDTMTYDPSVYADAVVVKYTWTDALGAAHTQYDAAGAVPARAGQSLDRDAVYPGPGAAAGILARNAGRGRSLAVAAVNDLTAAPGMGITITPPDTVNLVGYIASVVFRLPDREMAVETRGLVDVPPDSWLFGELYPTITSAYVHTHHATLAANAFTDWSQVL